MEEITFKVTKQEADIIANAVGNLPLNEVIGLWTKLQQQAMEQLQPKMEVVK